MLRFLFINRGVAVIFVLLFVSINMDAQSSSYDRDRYDQFEEEEEYERPPKEKILIRKDQGLALGIDLSPFIMRLIKNERTGLAFIARYGLVDKIWIGGELGYENIKYSNDSFSYKSNGTFIRAGIDYDVFNNIDFPTNDNIFVGFRYCYAWQSHESPNFKIVDDYWGDYSGSVSSSGVNSHSLDLLAGLRCEVLPMFYMGLSARMRIMLACKHGDDLEPYAIAGYGSGDTKVNFGFTYTLEYQAPMNRWKKK